MAINIENFKKLKEAITPSKNNDNKSPIIPNMGFNMADFVVDVNKYDGVEDKLDSCGTVACLAGWCYALNNIHLMDKETGLIPIPKFYDDKDNNYKAFREAAKWLGLTIQQAIILFRIGQIKINSKAYTNFDNFENKDITLEQTHEVLDKIIKTGKFNDDCWEEVLGN